MGSVQMLGRRPIPIHRRSSASNRIGGFNRCTTIARAGDSGPQPATGTGETAACGASAKPSGGAPAQRCNHSPMNEPKPRRNPNRGHAHGHINAALVPAVAHAMTLAGVAYRCVADDQIRVGGGAARERKF